MVSAGISFCIPGSDRYSLPILDQMFFSILAKNSARLLPITLRCEVTPPQYRLKFFATFFQLGKKSFEPAPSLATVGLVGIKEKGNCTLYFLEKLTANLCARATPKPMPMLELRASLILRDSRFPTRPRLFGAFLRGHRRRSHRARRRLFLSSRRSREIQFEPVSSRSAQSRFGRRQNQASWPPSQKSEEDKKPGTWKGKSKVKKCLK